MSRRPHPTKQRIEELIETYGADPSRWPVEERGLVEQGVPGDARLEELLLQAHELDEQLESWQIDEPSPALRASVAAIPVRVGQRGGFWAWWPFERVGWPAAALAATAVVGLVVGSWIGDPGAGALAGSTVVAGASETEDAPWVDLAGLTYGTEFDAEGW